LGERVKSLKILFVTKSRSDVTGLCRELAKLDRPIEHEMVSSATSMRDALAQTSWDAVISDWSSPELTALEALALSREANRDLPFFVVSTTAGEEAATEAMRAGARDYFVKDRLARLVPAFERELRDREGRKSAAATLQRSEGRLRRLYDSGLVGIAVTNLDRALVEANDAYLQLIGYTREELATGTIRSDMYTAPELLPQDDEAIATLKRHGFVRAWEKAYLRRDGTRVPVLVNAAMLDHPYCISVVVDLTEQKRSEQSLRKTEEQLRQAQKMDAIGNLAGGVAHDFNNILSVILSYSAMLTLDMDPNDPHRADIEQIASAGERATKLVRQLLAFGRKQVLQPRVMSLNEVVTGLEPMLRRLIGADVDLNILLSLGLGQVKIDPGQFEQVIMNLVVNSRDAMPSGGKLTIETSNVVLDEAYAATHLGARPGQHAMLAGSDTGSGMDKETQARMFEPFFTTKEVGRGTGLGLATVFGIVRQSGGNIWVYSEPGQGTTFKVYLPQTSDPRTTRKDTGASSDEVIGGSETILLVEDDPSVRALLRAVLRRFGYHVLDAQSAGDACILCEQHGATIHLLLTDVVMPRISGRQLAERLQPLRPRMKVLYMSGYTDHTIVHHGVLDSDVAFVEKPITPDLLARKVRQVLDSVPGAGASAT